MSEPIAAFGPDSVLTNPTFTLSAPCADKASAKPAAAQSVLIITPPTNIKKNRGQTPISSALHPGDPHLLVGDPAALDDHFPVELHGAVAQRHIVVPARVALAAALRIRTGGEEEVARER